MQKHIKQFASRFSGWLVVLALICSSHAINAANWEVRFVAGSIDDQGNKYEGLFIKGVHTKGFCDVYVTTDESHITNLVMVFDYATGLTWTSSAPSANIIKPIGFDAEFDIGVSLDFLPGAAEKTVEANPGTEVLLATTYFNYDSKTNFGVGFDAIKNIEITKAQSVTGTTPTKCTVIKNTDGTYIEVLKGFNFGVNGALVIDEDSLGNRYSAADDELFTCTAYDPATQGLVASDDVVFKSVKSFSSNVSAVIDNGELVIGATTRYYFTPADGNNDTVTVVVGKIGDTSCDEEVEIPVNIVNVDNPAKFSEPKLTVTTLKEGELIRGSLIVTVEDPDGEVTLQKCQVVSHYGKYSQLIDSDRSGTCTITDLQDGTWKVEFTSKLEVPYDTVVHGQPAPGCAFDFYFFDSTGEIRLPRVKTLADGSDITVEDTDRPMAITSITIGGTNYQNGDSFSISREALNDVMPTFSATAEDPDAEDTVVLGYSITHNDVTVSDLTDLNPGSQVVFQVNGRSYNGDNASATVTMTLTNSPMYVNGSAEETSVDFSTFILREQGKQFTEAREVGRFPIRDFDGVDTLTLLGPLGVKGDSLTVSAGDGRFKGTLKYEIVADSDDPKQGVIKVTFTPDANNYTPAGNDGDADVITYSGIKLHDTRDSVLTSGVVLNTTIRYDENQLPKASLADPLMAFYTLNEVDEEGNAVLSQEITFNVTDSLVYPAGIKSYELIPEEGVTVENVVANLSALPVNEGTWSGSLTFQVKTSGYDTITGENRKKVKGFKIRLKLTDVLGGETEAQMNVNVNDVDRKPDLSAAAFIFDKSEYVYGDTITATNPEGMTDADGDAITPVYTWKVQLPDGTVKTTDVNTAVFSGDDVAKGNTIICEVRAKTTPYDDNNEVVTDAYISESVVVGNTAPYITKVDSVANDDADTDVTATWTVNEVWASDDIKSFTMKVVATDVDNDALRYSVSALSLPGAGRVEIDENTGVVTYYPAYNYNTANVDEEPEFTVTVVDADNAVSTNSAKVIIVVTQRNNPPTVTGKDLYVLPDQRGVAQNATFAISVGDEMEQGVQSIALADVTFTVEEGEEIFESVPAATAVNDGSTEMTFAYTIKADAQLGKSARVKVVVKDNGRTGDSDDFQESQPVYFTVFVGASPWYPIVSFTCNDDTHVDGHTLRLATGTDSTDITVRGSARQLLPADYVARGMTGFTDDTEVEVTIFPWSIEKGTDTSVTCTEAYTITVAAYGLPGAAVAEGEGELLANGWYKLPKITVPMAQGYKMTVVNGDGEVVKNIGPVDFEPSANGMILPEINDLKLQFTKAGTYKVEVTGFNPNGEGESTEVLEVTIEDDNEGVLEWPADGVFSPGEGTVLTDATVRFSWPVVSAADGYELRIYNASGVSLYAIPVDGNSFSLQLDMPAGVASAYTWNVVACAGERRVASKVMNLTLVETTDTVVPTGVRAVNGDLVINCDGVLDPNKVVTCDIQYFSISDNKWINLDGVEAQRSATGSKELILPVASTIGAEADDFAVLTIYIDGQILGDMVIYQVTN